MLLDQPAHPAAPAATGVHTFLIADVRGYTRFTQEHGDAAAARLATRFADLVRAGLADTDGRLVDLRGDEVAVAFGSVRQALGPPMAGHTLWVQALTFSPDGKTLASGSADTTIKLWDMSLAGWRQLACRIANRNLTQQEWRQYLPDEPYHVTCPGLPAGS